MFWPHHMGGLGWGGWIIGGLFMLLVVVGLLVLAYFAIRSAASHQDGEAHQNEQNALEILKRRYARGEIDKAEYEAVRRDIDT